MGTSRPVLFLLTLPLGTASLFAVQADVHVYDFLAIKALVAHGHVSSCSVPPHIAFGHCFSLCCAG
jgi:hypothetical protein